jgi:heptosyltransferase-2
VAGFARDGRSLLLDQRLDEPAGPHALESFWAMADGLLDVSTPAPASINFHISAPARERAQALVAQRGWSQGYVCLAPFAAGTVHKLDKRWPGFPALAQRLSAQGLTVVVCPGPGELELARSGFPSAQVIEGLPLDTYAALLQASRLVVANDTGPGHIAAATGATLISVLGPTRVEQWRPWGPNVSLLSARPGWPEVDAVLAAALDRLA